MFHLSEINCYYLYYYMYIRGKSKQALKYKDHVAKIFNWAKNQEWIDADDSEKRTIIYQWLKDCLERYLYWVDRYTYFFPFL